MSNIQNYKDKSFLHLVKEIQRLNKPLQIEAFSLLLFDYGGLKVGYNRLYTWLRNEKYLMSNNNAYPKHIDSGLFKTETIPYRGLCLLRTLITPLGQLYLAPFIYEYFGTIDEPNTEIDEEYLLMDSDILDID